MPNRSQAHTALVRAIMAEVGSLPGVVIGVNESGRARYLNERTGKDFFVPYGWPSPDSGPDMLAVVAPLGRLVGLEVKTGNASPTREQRACHEALKNMGAVVAVVRSVDDARKAIDAARSAA